MKAAAALLIGASTIAAAPLRSSPDLGIAEGRCRTPEPGPAIIIEPRGLKDRQGLLRAELYPDNDNDFLADDNVLLNAGKTFRRNEIELPAAGPVTLCIRAPAPGTYTLSLLHDRDSNHKFGLSSDGIGFPGDPPLGLSKPAAGKASLTVGEGFTRVAITLNYRHGLFSIGPLKDTR